MKYKHLLGLSTDKNKLIVLFRFIATWLQNTEAKVDS